ncbi:MAG: lytic transglycosylase domain-containing protein [Nitrobacter sp.]
MRRTIAAFLGLLLLSLEPFAGSSPVVNTSGAQTSDPQSFVSSPLQLRTIAVAEFAPKSQFRLPTSDIGENADNLAGIPRSAELDAMDHSEIPTEGPPRSQVSTDAFCAALTAAAEASNIPVAFFARLIWQESRFKLDQTSPAGAQGVAQFMPRTATEVGLDDPFDPLKALPASARFLRRLHDKFGNLGLAAAAYNAGSRRIQSWLARREVLPAETRAYVRNITGSPADSWVSESKTLKLAQQLPAQAPCEGSGGLSRNQTNVTVSVSLTPAISSIVRKAEREAAAAARAAAKAVTPAKNALRIASIKLKTHKTTSVKTSGSASKTANVKRRVTKLASASEH